MSVYELNLETGQLTERELTVAELDAQQAASARDADEATAQANGATIRDRIAQTLDTLEQAWNFTSLPQATRDARRDDLVQLLARDMARLIRLEAHRLDQSL